MINLIPSEARKKMVTEYWFRVVSVWMFILSVVCVLVCVALVPTYVLIDGQERALAESAYSAEEEVATFDNVASAITEANNLSKVVIASSKRSLLSTYLEQIDVLVDQSVNLEGYSFLSEEGQISSIQIRGTANNRQALAGFRDSLRGLENIDAVDLPLSNLAQDRDIGFVITIKLNTTEHEQ